MNTAIHESAGSKGYVMNRSAVLITVAALAACGTGAASAATIVQNDNEVILRGFDGFDTRLGQLDTVTLDISVTKYRMWGVQTATAMTAPITWSATGQWQLSSYNPAIASVLVPISGSGTTTVTTQPLGGPLYTGFMDVQLSGTASLTFDTALFVGKRNTFTGFDLGYFYSTPGDTVFTGMADATYRQVPGGCSVLWNAGAEDLCGWLNFKLTYDYTPPVPEPATWAMMLSGFSLTGAALRRRRRQVAVA